MKTLIALACYALAALMLFVGVVGGLLVRDDLSQGSLDQLATGELPESSHYEVTGGRLMLPRSVLDTALMDQPFAVLVPAAAAQLEPLRSAERIFVAQLQTRDLRDAARRAGAKLADRDLGPGKLLGGRLPREDWPLGLESWIEQDLQVDPERVVCLKTQDKPLNAQSALLCALLGLAFWWLGRRLRRSGRSSKASAGFEWPSLPDLDAGCGATLLKLGGAAVALAMVLARFADNGARSADELVSLRQATRQLDELPARAVGSAVDEGLDAAEVALRGLDLADTIDKAQKIHSILKGLFGADITLTSTIEVATSKERYAREGSIYRLLSIEESKRSTLVRNGKLVQNELSGADDLPDAARGEFQTLRVQPPVAGRPAELEMLLATRVETGHLIQETLRGAVEAIDGSWDQYAAGATIRVRYTQEGLQQLRSCLELGLQRGLTVMEKEFERQGFDRLEFEVEVSELANATISLGPERGIVTAEGPTVLRASMAAWK